MPLTPDELATWSNIHLSDERQRYHLLMMQLDRQLSGMPKKDPGRASLIAQRVEVVGRMSAIKAETKLRDDLEQVELGEHQPDPKKMGPRDLRAALIAQQYQVASLRTVQQQAERYYARLSKEVTKRGLLERELGIEILDDESVAAYLRKRGWTVIDRGEGKP